MAQERFQFVPYKIKYVVSIIGIITMKQAANNNNPSNVINVVPQTPTIKYFLEDLILNKL